MEVREPSAKYLAKAAYKQTELGIIPADWECSEIGPFIDLLTGFPFPSKGYVPSGIRLLRGSNIKRGNTDWSEDLTAYWSSVSSEIRKYVLEVGDVVVAMDGSLVGKSFASLSEADIPALLLQRVARIRSGQVKQSYLRTWICSPRFTEHCDAVKTTTAIPHISPLDIRSFKIAIPPSYEEQQAIAEALSDADALIESLDQLLAKKRQIKQGAMQELLTGQKRLPGFSGEWDETTLGSISERIIGGGTPSRNNPAYWNGNIPWMTVKDFACFSALGTLEYITKQGLENSSSNLVPRGTLITSTRMALGRAVIFEVDVCINQDLKAIHFRQDIDPGFMFFWFQFNEPQISGLGSGSTVMGISLPELKKIPLLKPRHAEQTAIATVLSDLDTEIAALEARLAKARLLKQGMMQELLTGRIRLV